MEIILNQPYSFHQIGKRDYQQDSRFPDEDMPKDYKPFFVLCDGVGGSNHGEIASKTVCLSIAKAMKNVNFEKEFSFDDFQNVLTYMYDSLYKVMKTTTLKTSTTLTFLCFHKGGVLAAHIGDSRIYLLRPDFGVIYRSEDHSLVNALVHSGSITPDQAKNHPQSNYITRSVGYSENLEDRDGAKAVQLTDIQQGDYFFMCSDGVLENIDDDELLQILSQDISDEEKIKEIAQKSKNSSDNNTAILIGIKDVVYDVLQGEEADSDEWQDNNETTTIKVKDALMSKDVYPKENKSFINRLKSYFK